VVGGATLVGSLLNADLLDELRLIVHPILLGGGKALFAGVTLAALTRARRGGVDQAGRVILKYKIGP